MKVEDSCRKESRLFIGQFEPSCYQLGKRKFGEVHAQPQLRVINAPSQKRIQLVLKACVFLAISYSAVAA